MKDVKTSPNVLESNRKMPQLRKHRHYLVQPSPVIVGLLSPGRESDLTDDSEKKTQLNTGHLTANTGLSHFIVILTIEALGTRNTGIGLNELC